MPHVPHCAFRCSLGVPVCIPGHTTFSWCFSGHPRSHHLPFGAAQEPLCAFQFAPWAFWCPLHPLAAFSDPSSLSAFFLCPQKSLSWLFLHQNTMFGFCVLAGTVFLLGYPRAVCVPFGAPGGLWVVWSIPKPPWGCQTTPGLSVFCPRTELAAKSSF